MAKYKECVGRIMQKTLKMYSPVLIKVFESKYKNYKNV